MLLRGRGRLRVRRIIRSMSRSSQWLMALAPPAVIPPPSSTAISSFPDGTPWAAINIPPSAVNQSSSMIGGLVSVR